MSETNVSAIAALQMRLKLEPKNPEAHFNLAVAYEETGSYEQALDEYDKSLDLNPLYARSLLHIGFISIKRNEPGKALDLWERAFTIDAKLAELFSTSPTAAYYKGKIDDVCAFFQKNVNSNPKNAKAHYELGLVYKYFNKLELALQCFRTATELNGVMWEAYLKCGETYSLLGVTKMALEQLKYGILANPGNENPVIYLALAEVYMKENMMGLAQQQLNKAIELDDKSVKAYVMRGKLFFRLANFKMAMKNYQTALGIDPKNSDAHYQLAKTCEAMYRPEFALLELEKAVACNPDFAEAYYDWGNLLLQMGETEKAIPKLEYVLKVNPNDSYAHYTLGTAYLKTEDYHAALHHFKSSTQINPTDAYTYYNMGICCVKIKDLQGALQAFLKAMELAPNDSTYCYQRYLVNMSLMNFEDAEADIKRAIKAKPTDVEYRLKLVALYKRQKNYQAILDELNNFININPKISSVYSEMGMAYSAMGDADVAKVSFEKALALDPNDVRAIYGKASLLKASGIKLREAKDMLSKTLEIDPFFLPALEELGLMYFEEGNVRKGDDYYKIALDHASPEEVNGVKVNYAEVLIQTGHYDKGIAVFDSLVQERPEDARLRLSLARAYKVVEKYDDAITQLHIAQELEPENPAYPMELGALFADLGLIDEARDTYYTIIHMYPTHIEAQKALTDLLSKRVPATPSTTIEPSFVPMPGQSPSESVLDSEPVSEPSLAEPSESEYIESNSNDSLDAESEKLQSEALPSFDTADSSERTSAMSEIFSEFESDEVHEINDSKDNEDNEEFVVEELPELEFDQDIIASENIVPASKEEDFSELQAPSIDLTPDFDLSSLPAESDDMIAGFELPRLDSEPSVLEPSNKADLVFDIPEIELDAADKDNKGSDVSNASSSSFGARLQKAKKTLSHSNSLLSNTFSSSDSKELSQEDIFGSDDNFNEQPTGIQNVSDSNNKSAALDSFAAVNDDIFGEENNLFGEIDLKVDENEALETGETEPGVLSETAAKSADNVPNDSSLENVSAGTKSKSGQSAAAHILDLDSELDALFDFSDFSDEDLQEPEIQDDGFPVYSSVEEDNSRKETSAAEQASLNSERQQLEKLLLAQPSNVDTRKLLVSVCMKLGDYEAAYINAKELLKQMTPSYKDLIKFITIYIKAGKAEELEQLQEYISQAEPDPSFIGEICEKLLEANLPDFAISECRRCSKAYPSNVDVSLLLGKIYTRVGNPALATLQYQKVIRKSSDVSVNLLLADAYESMNNIKGSIKTLRKYLDAMKDDVEVWVKYMLLLDYSAAVEEKEGFNNAIKLHPLTAEQRSKIEEHLGKNFID